jgi:hypothetical protein
VDVGEVLAQFGRVPLHPLVQRDAEALGEELDALGGDIDEVGGGARRDLGEDLREEVRPVDGLHRVDPELDVGVHLAEAFGEGADGLWSVGGAEGGDDEGTVVAAGDVGSGEPVPARCGAGQGGGTRAVGAVPQQRAAGDVRVGHQRA